MSNLLTDAQYIESMYSMFGGPDETEIKCRTVAMVKVRKEHPCMCPAHEIEDFPTHVIKAGDRAVRDKAIADGLWGSCYVCLLCLKSWWDHCRNGSDYCCRNGKRGSL